MPFAIDDEAIKAKQSLDINSPPLKSIPFQEYPRLVYKHPKRPFRQVERKDAAGNTVEVTYVPSEHKYRSVANEAEFKQALAEGWRTDPYVPKGGVPDPLDELYDDILQEKKGRKAE